MPTLPRRLFWLAFHADAQLDLAFRRARKVLGIARPLRILPYGGFGSRSRVCVKARVLEDRGVPPPVRQRTLLGTAIASYKRYATVEIPNAVVRVTWRGHAWETRTDDEGFVDVWVEPPPGTRPGWQRVTLELVAPADEESPPRVEAPVLVVGDRAGYGVISDIDDTVIVTGVTNPLKRAYALFLTDHRTRVPFEGVSELYSAFQYGPDGEGANPIFYVSSSPWNLYEHLEHFLSVQDIPPGPILLRDWGLTREGFAPGGGHGHKLAKIREVLAALPHLPFVLVGDSGQEDPEHYRTIVREEGPRILAVYIRTAHTRAARQAELALVARDIRDHGSEMIVVPDSVAAARDAAARGLIPKVEIGLVEERKREDEQQGGPIEELLGDD